jgi:hypothetical protein
MKKRGKIDKSALAKFGINVSGPVIQEEEAEGETRNPGMPKGRSSSVLVT